MNILFITLIPTEDLQTQGLYSDMLRTLVSRGHSVSVTSPVERRMRKKTRIAHEDGATFLCVRTLNNTKVSFLEKGFALLTTPWLLYRSICKCFSHNAFDLILYSTPPITIASMICRLKRKYAAHTYLLLKDIWPQSAVDLGMLRDGSVFYRYLRAKERLLYSTSEYIGAMSPANVSYVLNHNPQVTESLVEVCPNSLIPRDVRTDETVNAEIRAKYGIALSATLFVYGGNLGAPQGIPFLLEILESYVNDPRVFFMFIGSGTQYNVMDNWMRTHAPDNMLLAPQMPVQAYQALLSAANVGLLFLDKRFTVPNVPSRILDYAQASLPMLAATDSATDIGTIILEKGMGFACSAGDLPGFRANVERLLDSGERARKGALARAFLEANWTSDHTCDIILGHFKSNAE